MSEFQALKLRILEILDLSRDAVHIHLGLITFLAVVLITRQRRSWWWAWIAVAIVALVLELLDLRDDLATFGTMRWTAAVHDLVNTLFWPTVLALLGQRFLPLPHDPASQSD